MPTTVVNRKIYDYEVYIGRPSKWGNAWSHLPSTIAKFRVASRIEAIMKYRAWILSQPILIAQIETELKGRVLGCWCKPLACHGDILAAIADGRPIPYA